jgi:GntR family transcriptional repressor for pyruvate dehydrogenase complex
MKTLFDEVESTSRSRQIVEKFRKAIGDGALRIGDKLPPERELCVQLGVSRTSLREAIRMLRAYGVLEATQGGGTYVTDKFSENIFEFLGFGTSLDKKNFLHLLHVRDIIESGAVEKAASSANEAALERLESLVESLENESDTTKLGLLDATFHETIIEMAGNPILTAFYRMIFKMLMQGTSRVIALPSARAIAMKDHRNIFKALKSGDSRKCKSLIRKHMQATTKLIETYLNEES